MVGSGCDNDMSVRKDSESKGVGSADNRDKTTDMRTKSGSCDRAGDIIEGRGRQLCSSNNCFRRAVSCEDGGHCQNPKSRNILLARTNQLYRPLHMHFLEILLVSTNPGCLHLLQHLLLYCWF
jgi:hypothetical protein